MAIRRKPTIHDLPSLCLMLSFVFSLGMLFMLMADYEVFDRSELHSVSGGVVRLETSGRGNVSVDIKIPKIGQRTFFMDYFGCRLRKRCGLEPDQEISLWADQRKHIWELRRNNEILLTYEEARAYHEGVSRRATLMGQISAGVSFTFLVVAVVLRLRLGAWTGRQP